MFWGRRLMMSFYGVCRFFKHGFELDITVNSSCLNVLLSVCCRYVLITTLCSKYLIPKDMYYEVIKINCGCSSVVQTQ